MMKNKIAFIFLFVSGILFAHAQEKTFIVDQNINHLADRVIEFRKPLSSKDEIFDVIKGDRFFMTDISINQEKYKGISVDHYLKVKYVKAPSAGVISSDWYIRLEQIDTTKTKVTIKLKKVLPDQNLKENIDITQTISSGKLEKQLEKFLNVNSNKL